MRTLQPDPQTIIWDKTRHTCGRSNPTLKPESGTRQYSHEDAPTQPSNHNLGQDYTHMRTLQPNPQTIIWDKTILT
ncbi:hypothetical protein DPMN_169823 [Dreissena polymorpha]|uniref:Uncharacterized protein n=1 Tax=Dreissena polymorpha TaxID=45954 RepID=A0A9D4ICL7_DREPO|nr:hypothetical protein DPMN_169823 [Dreissena polymorpha]